MKLQKTKILNEDVLQIYITEKEENNVDVNKQIEELKNNNKNVVIFVSGKEDIASTLQYIINKKAMQMV